MFDVLVYLYENYGAFGGIHGEDDRGKRRAK